MSNESFDFSSGPLHPRRGEYTPVHAASLAEFNSVNNELGRYPLGVRIVMLRSAGSSYLSALQIAEAEIKRLRDVCEQQVNESKWLRDQREELNDEKRRLEVKVQGKEGRKKSSEEVGGSLRDEGEQKGKRKEKKVEKEKKIKEEREDEEDEENDE